MSHCRFLPGAVLEFSTNKLVLVTTQSMSNLFGKNSDLHPLTSLLDSQMYATLLIQLIN
jgi:hypothetical protein